MPSLISKTGHLDYFGRLSWGNLVDWMITAGLGGYVALTTVNLGGVRPETQLALLPLLVGLLALHGLWFALDREEGAGRISAVPLAFVPFLLFVALSGAYLSPAEWLGSYRTIAFGQAFIVFWLLVNNVRTRAHLWAFLILALAPTALVIFLACYQFFQDPAAFADAISDYSLQMPAAYLGRSSGSFADPSTFAVFGLGLFPALLIAALAPRLPAILRVLSSYLAAIILFTVLLAQELWTLPLMVLVTFIGIWFSKERLKARIWTSFLIVLVIGAVIPALLYFFPRIQTNLEAEATGPELEFRMALGNSAFGAVAGNPLTGTGSGAFPLALAGSPAAAEGSAENPENAYLGILAEYGSVGLLLFLAPIVVSGVRGFRRWRAEPYTVRVRGSSDRIMPPQRFFLSLGLAGGLTFALCACFHFIFSIPALLSYGVIYLAVMVKNAFRRSVGLPVGVWFRLVYLGLGVLAAFAWFSYSAPRLESHARTLFAEERLAQIVDARIHISGDVRLLEKVLDEFETAVLRDPGNVDAWIGLSSANCQLFFRNPGSFDQIAEQATAAAEEAVRRSGAYWRAWAQLGVARSFAGEEADAELALRKALELAPHSSNANYYWAAFNSYDPDRLDEAVRAVDRALELDPGNEAARRLQQKLRIL